jgi:RNA polymerase sigma factor for flagellar operon FliA
MEVWRTYRKTASDELRNFLIDYYLDLVKSTAERTYLRQLQGVIDLEDYVSAGLIGLMEALDGFDPGRGVPFRTYATRVIQNKIIDQVRAMDWVPRDVRYWTTALKRARGELQAQLGRPPTDQEVLDRLGVAEAQYGKILREVARVQVVSLNNEFETDSSKED